MSTTIVTTWATDISQLGPIYPFVGSEFLMFIVAVVFWIGFHIIQFRKENEAFKEQIAKFADAKHLEKAVKPK